MKTIAFYGPDGSGKTTLAKLLSWRLGSRGYSIRILWIRGLHTLALLTALFLKRFKSQRGMDFPQIGIRIRGRRIWCFIESISLIPVIIKNLVLSRGVDLVLYERSFVDSIAWLLTHYNGSTICMLMNKFLLSLTMRYDAIIYVRAGIDEILRRRRGLEHIPKRFLKRQIMIYDIMYKYLSKLHKNTYIIDTTNKKPASSLREVLGIIKGIE